MINKVRVLTAIILSVFIISLFSSAKDEKEQSKSKIKIAVIEFISSESDSALSAKFFNIFYSKMKKYKEWEMLQSSAVKEEMEKFNYVSGEDIPSGQLIEIGENLKAYYVIYTKLIKQKTFYVLDTSIVNIEYKKESKCRITVIKDINDMKDIEDQLERLILSIQDRKYFFDMVKRSSDYADERKDKTPQEHLDRIKFLKESFDEIDGEKYTLQFGVQLHGGYNILSSGYRDYRNNYGIGAELKIRMIYENNRIGQFGFYLSLDEFPMAVPEGTYGIQEDLFNLNFGANFCPFPDFIINPYIGFGAGFYFDWVRYDTPASGALSSFHTFLGIDPKFGIEWAIMKNLKIVTQAKYNVMFTPAKGSYITSHFTVSGGLLLYF